MEVGLQQERQGCAHIVLYYIILYYIWGLGVDHEAAEEPAGGRVGGAGEVAQAREGAGPQPVLEHAQAEGQRDAHLGYLLFCYIIIIIIIIIIITIIIMILMVMMNLLCVYEFTQNVETIKIKLNI